MKIIKVEEKNFTKLYKIVLALRSIISLKPFELVVLRDGLSKLGVGVSYLTFTNEELKDDLKLSNLLFSCERIWFKHGLVKIDDITKYLKRSEHAELASRVNVLKKERVSMTVGHVTKIYPPFYKLFRRYEVNSSLEFNEIII